MRWWGLIDWPESFAMPAPRPRNGLSLSVGEKTSFILALALTPFLVMVGRSALRAQPALDAIAVERAGLRYLHDIARVERMLDIGGFDRSEAIDTLAQAEASYGAGAGTATLASQTIAALQRGAGQGEVDQLLEALVERILVHADLAHEASPGAAPLRELALTDAPALRAAIDALAAVVGDGANARLSESRRANLLRAIGGLEGALRPFDLWRAPEGHDSNALDARLANVHAAVSFVSQGLLESLHGRRFDAAHWQERLHAAGAALRDLESADRVAFDHLLDERAARLEGERWVMLALAALLLAGVLSAGHLALRRTLIEPLRALEDATGDLISGRYEQDIPLQNRADEFGAIARFLETFRELARARIEAEVARQTAENASLSKSQFIANMSHELRTPLNAIIGYSEIMLEDCDDPANTCDLERVLAAARHLLGLINDILDLSKVEAGRMALNIEEIEPAGVVDDVLAAIAPAVTKNGSQLVVENLARNSHFGTDVLKLRQCLLNLLSNAAKFTKNGVIRFTIEDHSIEGAPALRFTVADTGIGMTRQQVQRLFQPFAQADESITREYGGTGLGLMLTKRMADLLGGAIEVSSEKNAGSVFTLTVRAFAAAAPAAPQPALAADAPLVLVIDDEKDVHHLASETLAPLGFRVQGAPNAGVGLDFARLRAGALAAIVLDINLPDRPGWSVLAALKSDAATASIPVIVLSIDADRQMSSSLGAAEHLVKPVAGDVLAATCLRLARRRQDDAAAPTEERRAAG